MSAVFFFLLGFPLSKNPVRQFSAISLSIIWYFIWKTLFYLFPNTLIAIIVMTLLFDDKIQYKIYWGIIFIFAEGFINKLICTILFSLTDKLDKWCLFPIPHILDCTIFVIMILISFILKNYKASVNFPDKQKTNHRWKTLESHYQICYIRTIKGSNRPQSG